MNSAICGSQHDRSENVFYQLIGQQENKSSKMDPEDKRARTTGLKELWSSKASVSAPSDVSNGLQA